MITVYTQPGCKLCERSLEKLEESGLGYEAVDLSEDPKALFYVTEVLECRTLPVIVSGETVIRGFQPDQLKSLIEESAEDCPVLRGREGEDG